MRRVLTFSLFAFLLFGIRISAQSNQVSNSSDADNFPVYINTGNPELDAMNYDNAKRKWIEKNPDMYMELNGGNMLDDDAKRFKASSSIIKRISDDSNIERPQRITTDKHIIDKSEFELMSLEKQQHILANPDKYLIVDPQ